MNRKMISQAISDIDDIFIAEALTPDHAPERTAMETKKYFRPRRITALILAACLMFTLATTAYAADIGGIQRKIQIWRYGDQTTAVLDIQNGEYSVTGEDGTPMFNGGGVAIEPNGSERPLTEEEILEHLDSPDLLYKEDGSIWVFYRAQQIEITDLYNDDGICYLMLKDGEEVLYLTITKENGMAVSPNAYPQPDEFHISRGIKIS